jgi:hypothetical protein
MQVTRQSWVGKAAVFPIPTITVSIRVKCGARLQASGWSHGDITNTSPPLWFATTMVTHLMLVGNCWRPGSPQKLGYAAVRGQRSVFFSKRRKNSTSTELTSPLAPTGVGVLPRGTNFVSPATYIVGSTHAQNSGGPYMHACVGSCSCCLCESSGNVLGRYCVDSVNVCFACRRPHCLCVSFIAVPTRGLAPPTP